MSHPNPRTQPPASKPGGRIPRPQLAALVAVLALCLLPYLGRAFSIIGSVASQAEPAAAAAFSIRGTIRTAGGAPVADVLIRITGDSSVILTTTDNAGVYFVDGLTAGVTYTVTPSRSGLAFTPPSRVFPNLDANQTGADFTAAAGQAFSVRGKIANSDGVPVADVLVRVTGDSSDIVVTTDNAGNYVVEGLTGGRDYTVTPSKTGVAFSPPNRVFANLSANQTGADFTATAGQLFGVSGTIRTAAGAPIADVVVRVTGDSSVIIVTTDNAGNYVVSGLTGGVTYTVTPSKTNFAFTPPSRVFSNLTANQTGADFTGAAGQAFSVRGKVTDQLGAPIADVLIRVTGDSNVFLTTTDNAGNYVVEGLTGGRDYTVTPSKTGLAFTPPSRVFTGINANQTGADFTTGGGQPTPTPTPTAATVHFGSANLFVSEGVSAVLVTVTREGDSAGSASVNYATSDGTAVATSDYNAAYGTLRFAPGETEKSVTVFITDDSYGEGPETFSLTLSDPVGAAVGTPSSAEVTINSNEGADGPNPMRVVTFNPEFFVRRHYIDFFNREADAPGLAFWLGELTSCGADAACLENKKINVSGAFFLSIEFQQTGYLVYRAYTAAFGPTRVGGTVPLTLREFLPDTQAIGRGVVIGQPGADELLEQNRVAYFEGFVTRPSFLALYPASMPAAQFVDALNQNTGGSLSQAERDDLVAGLTAGTISRAQALRAVAQDADLRAREFNRAFVLMQYFGYLRRNPSDAPEETLDFQGYDFWLKKLNDNNGNFVAAEMVKAFINSEEYKKRFGP